jgi:hypothetical protein
LKFATFAPGRADADPAPRGAEPEAGDGSAAQTCSSVHPAETEAGFGGVCVSKNRILGSASELVLGVKREDATARFLRRGFLMDFSCGILCSAYTERYPIPASGLYALRSVTPSERNVRNATENIERMEPPNIVTHYNHDGV